MVQTIFTPIDWSFPYPENCSSRRLRELLRDSAAARFLSRRLPVPRIVLGNHQSGSQQKDTEEESPGNQELTENEGEESESSPSCDKDEEANRKIAFRVFDLATRLDSRPRIRPPTHVSVLRLYCCKNFSITQIMRECGCSHGTVMNRKRDLEKNLGMALDAYRQYSGIFEEAEKTAEYAKAKKVYRKDLLN